MCHKHFEHSLGFITTCHTCCSRLPCAVPILAMPPHQQHRELCEGSPSVIACWSSEVPTRQADLQPALSPLAHCDTALRMPRSQMSCWPSGLLPCPVSGPCTVAGLFDPQKEADRLTKQRDKLAGEIQGMDARLSNQKFVSKAPEKVLQMEHTHLLSIHAPAGSGLDVHTTPLYKGWNLQGFVCYTCTIAVALHKY